jgi:hypothetical protein
MPLCIQAGELPKIKLQLSHYLSGSGPFGGISMPAAGVPSWLWWDGHTHCVPELAFLATRVLAQVGQALD